MLLVSVRFVFKVNCCKWERSHSVFKVLREDEVLKDWTHSSQETHCNVFNCSTTASNRHCHQGCSLGLERLDLETVLRRFFERLSLVSIPSLQSLGLISVSTLQSLGLVSISASYVSFT